MERFWQHAGGSCTFRVLCHSGWPRNRLARHPQLQDHYSSGAPQLTVILWYPPENIPRRTRPPLHVKLGFNVLCALGLQYDTIVFAQVLQ